MKAGLAWRTGLVLCLAAAASAGADTPASESSATAQSSSPAESSAAPTDGSGAAAESPSPAGQDLVRDTLGRDIQTAGYYELVAWCGRLGLEQAGDRRTLQQRLYSFYGAEQPSAEAEAGEQKILEIKSAQQTEYFQVEEIGEDYVVLEGDVLIELREEQAVHRIRAHRVVVNQSANLLTAEGGIEYTLIKGDEEELFKGQSLTFDITKWEGVFFGGGIEAERNIAGRQVRFRFEGESISRLENDNVVMSNSLITSCDLPADPHYHIQAQKIWILAPNEWAVLNAVLYVGRIPILYLPFFFHPGDEFFFHPAIGYRNREGELIQTTSYLLGQKKRQESALSFLAATEQSGVQYRQEPHGLFLQQVKGQPVQEGENRYLKILLDLYSRLGGFVGIQGSFPPNVEFFGGIAVSRTVYPVPATTLYTPWDLSSGVYSSSWNRGWLFGLELPFRFGADASWSQSWNQLRLSGSFEYYSDPFFTSDFLNRSEQVDLTRLIGLGEAPEAAVEEQRNLTWQLNGQADFSSLLGSPFLNRLSVPYFNAILSWQSQPNQLLSGNDALYDPGRLFYYPVNFRSPSASVRVAGELLNVSVPPLSRAAQPAGAARAAAPAEIKGSLRVPEPLDVEVKQPKGNGPPREGPPAGAEGGNLRLPERKPDVPVQMDKTPLSFRLGYQVKPAAIVEQRFHNEEWQAPEDVSYELDYTSLEATGIASLDYSLKVLEDVLGLSGSLAYSGSYRTRFRQSFQSQADWENLVFKTDYPFTQMNLKNALNLSYHPFSTDPIFGSSSLSYGLTWTFYRYLFDAAASSYGNPVYYGLGPEWNDDTVTQNLLQASLAWQPELGAGSLALSLQLPPMALNVSANLTFTLWALKTSINTVLQEQEGIWSYAPLAIQETLAVTEDVSLVQDLRLDLQSGNLLTSVSSFNWDGLRASFTAQRQMPQIFTTGKWQDDPAGVEGLLPSYVSLGYLLSEGELYFWKNRIKLEGALNTAWSMNIQQFTQNSLDFSLSLRCSIYKFLDLSFTAVSSNKQTFRYFPGLVDRLNLPSVIWVNPLTDLLRSFNFFNIQDRYASNFKLSSIAVEAVHHLHDWDLTLSYQGGPTLGVDAAGNPQYQWGSSFTVLLQWIPLPEMRSQVKGDESGLYLRS